MSPREGAVRVAAGISLGLAMACSSPVEAEDAFEVEATVSLVAVNGGCWSLIVGDSLSFEPLDLPEEFMQDGLRVHARLKPQTEFGSRCQVGQVIELLGIEALD